MPRKSEFVRAAEAEISRLDKIIKNLDKRVMGYRAEIKALKQMLEWNDTILKRNAETRAQKKGKEKK